MFFYYMITLKANIYISPDQNKNKKLTVHIMAKIKKEKKNIYVYLLCSLIIEQIMAPFHFLVCINFHLIIPSFFFYYSVIQKCFLQKVNPFFNTYT